MKKGAKKFRPLWLLAALCATFTARPVLAGDDRKNEASAATGGVKLNDPKTDLTERERWLLGRVEQLEKRVAELEGKSQPAPASPAAPPTPPASTPESGNASPEAGAASAFPSAATVITPSSGGVKPSSENATSSSTRSEKAVPFAFAEDGLTPPDDGVMTV